MHTQPKLLRKFARGLLAVSLAVTANIASATSVLYEQTPLSPPDGYQADQNAGFLNADDFTVSHVLIESISWWGTFLDTNTNNFAVRLFDDLTTSPDGIPALGGSLTSITPLPSGATVPEFYLYQFDLTTPLELLAGKHYLAIESKGDSTWYWLYGNPGNATNAFFDYNDQTWYELANDYDMAFRLEGDTTNVPEPDTLALFLIGYGLMVRARQNLKLNPRT